MDMEFYVFLNIWVELKCTVYLEYAENLLLQRCSHLQEGRPLSLEGKEGSCTLELVASMTCSRT